MSIHTGDGRTNGVRNNIVVRGTPFLHKLLSSFQRVSISQLFVTQESTQGASRSQPLGRNRRCGQQEKRPKQDAEQQEYVAGMASNDRHGGGGSSTVQEVFQNVQQAETSECGAKSMRSHITCRTANRLSKPRHIPSFRGYAYQACGSHKDVHPLR